MENYHTMVVIIVLLIFIYVISNGKTVNNSNNKIPNLSKKITDRVIININNYIKNDIIEYSKNKMNLPSGIVTTNGLNGDELIKSVPNIIFNTIYTNLLLSVDSKSLDALESNLRSSKINGGMYTFILHKDYTSIQFKMIEAIGGDTSYQLINELKDELNAHGQNQIKNKETIKTFKLSVLERLILGSDVLHTECSYIVSSILEILNL